MERERAVSSVVAVVLMVAMTVIMAAAVGSFVLDVAGVDRGPAPQVANADAELQADVAGGTDQTVRITHRGGDTVDVSDLEVVVAFSDSPKRSRLTGVPTPRIGASDYEGDDLWDGSYGGVGGALASDEPAGSDGEWSSGESLVFRVANDDVSLDAGDRVTVTVAHEPSGTVLLERTLTASASVLEPTAWSPPRVAFAASERGQRSYASQIQSATAAASRSWAVGYETLAGRPPACP